jgi:Flp pilus assembly protein TadG
MFLRNRLPGRTSRGQSLVETALILPIIVLVMLLGIDLGRVFFASIDLRNAAHEATMLGGTEPDATCADMKATVDRQMGRTGQPNAAVCSALGATTDVVYITANECERIDLGPACDPFDDNAPYPANSDLRYRVQLEYRFQPVVPLVGFLTGNGMGGSLPIRAENRSPVLVGYEGS